MDLIKLILIVYLIISLPIFILAQKGKEVRGNLVDSSGKAIAGATVHLISAQDTITLSTGGSGIFIFKNVKSSTFQMEINSLGYSLFKGIYEFESDSIVLDLKSIVLTENSIELEEVAIDVTPEVIVKGDTIEFKTRHIELDKYAITEDLMKKLPGMKVDLDGRLSLYGKPIDKVRINGIDFFGGDIALALKNLPANLMDKVQVIDDYGEEAALTGIKKGQPQKVLNLIVDEKRNQGLFSNASLGVGTSEVYEMLLAGNAFRGAKQLGASLGKKNAIQNGVEVLTGTLNLTIPLKENLVNKMNYSFNENVNSMNSSTYTEQVFADEKKTISDVLQNRRVKDDAHTIVTSIGYSPNKLTKINLNPTFKSSKGVSTNSSQEVFRLYVDNQERSIQKKKINESRMTHDNGVQGNFLINQRVGTAGRNINLSSNFEFSESLTKEDNESQLSVFDRLTELTRDSLQKQQIGSKSGRNLINLSLSYSESLGEKSMLDIVLNQSMRFNKSIRSVNDAVAGLQFVDSLSTFSEHANISSVVQLNYRYQTDMFNFMLGLGGENSILKSKFEEFAEPTKQHTFNWTPSITGQWGTYNSLMLNFDYSVMTMNPSLVQLNPVADRSDPQNSIIGNPDLRSQLIHTGSLRFQNQALTRGLFSELSLNGVYFQNKIVNNTVLLMDAHGFLSRETRYENMSGDYMFNLGYSTRFPLLDKKGDVSYSGGLDITKQYFFENASKAFSNSIGIRQSVSFSLRPTEGINIQTSASYAVQKNAYSVQEMDTKPLSSFDWNAQGQFVFFKAYHSVFTITKRFNKGFGGSTMGNPMLINLSIQKQFFKNKSGVLKLTTHDLLDQNIAMSSMVTGSSRIDHRANTNGRYLMLSYSQRIGKF